jgi:hypothetical protein
MKSGYRIMERDSQDLEDSLRLYHPATKRVRYSEIIIFNDSAIVGGLWVDGGLAISAEENVEFRNFIGTIPTPTWWEKSENLRVSISVWLTLGAIFLGPAIWGLYKKYLPT